MKKLIGMVTGLVLAGTVTVSAQDAKPAPAPAPTPTEKVTAKPTDETPRVEVKYEELPDAVKKSLASEPYTGWSFLKAVLVKDKTEYYEIDLKKEDKVKNLKMNKEGKLI